MSGFGMAQVKQEGASVRIDSSATDTDKAQDKSRWMEINIPEKSTRAEIHALVDEWINDEMKGI